ncbi:MAG: erythromycin esterase family protein [Phycisphaeraceae bacterium]
MMTEATGNSRFTAWLREHATSLASLDPDVPLDDLEPLQELVGDARVVAVGENAHFIHEFALARRRILRFLVERCGFTIVAFEHGFSEGFALDAWAQEAGPDEELDRLTAGTIPLGVDEPLRWLRQHNRTSSHPARFVGIDIPAAGGSLLPALTPLADYLRVVDPEVLPRIDTAMQIAERFAGTSMAVAAPAWARLDGADQNTLTATLMRLRTRFRALEPLYVSRSDQLSYDIALRRLEAACHADYHFPAMVDLYAGRGLPADTSAREVFMAESVDWHLNHADPGARMVLFAHNAHIQKAPISFGGHLTALPMGQHLHRTLGSDYLALGLTSTAGRTAEMHVDENARFGFTVEDLALEPPEPGSIESAFADGGLGLALADLRRSPRGNASQPDRIRMQSDYLHTPVRDAFDAVLNIPRATVAEGHGIEAVA